MQQKAQREENIYILPDAAGCNISLLPNAYWIHTHYPAGERHAQPTFLPETSTRSGLGWTYQGSKRQAAAKASSKQATTRKMGKNHNSVVVHWVWPNFWWMIPRGMRDNHTTL